MFEELKSLSKNQLKKLLAIILLSDGSIVTDRSYKNQVYQKGINLTTIHYNKEQHILFKWLCEHVYNRTPKTNIIERKGKKFLVSELYSVKIVKDLHTLTPSYQTGPNGIDVKLFLKTHKPSMKFIFNEPAKFKWLVFRLWFDFEGSITPTFRVSKKFDKKKYLYYQSSFETQFYISAGHPTIVKELKKLYGELNLTAKIKKDKRNWYGLGGIRVTKRDNIKEIIKRGPITSVKISNKSPRFKGIKKRKICELIGEIYKKLPSSKHFKDKNQAESFKKENYEKMLNILETL